MPAMVGVEYHVCVAIAVGAYGVVAPVTSVRQLVVVLLVVRFETRSTFEVNRWVVAAYR